jgi:hypothetical protein
MAPNYESTPDLRSERPGILFAGYGFEFAKGVVTGTVFCPC